MRVSRRVDEDALLRAALDATFEREKFVDTLMGTSINRHQHGLADGELGHSYSDCLAILVEGAAQWKIAHGGDVYAEEHREGFWTRTLYHACVGHGRAYQGTTTTLNGDAAALLDALKQVSKP